MKAETLQEDSRHLEMQNALIPEEKYPAEEVDVSFLTERGILPPLNNLDAKGMVRFIRSAEGMRGNYAGLDQRRIEGIKEMQEKFKRNTVLLAKPMILRPKSDGRGGIVYNNERSKEFVPVKMVDVITRSFETKVAKRVKMSEVGIQKETPLSDYELKVLVKEAGNFVVKKVSLAFIQ